MKLIIAIVQTEDAYVLSDSLTEAKFSVTKLSTTGGFLRMDNMTLLIGTEDVRVEEALDLIKKACNAREQIITSQLPSLGGESEMHAYPLKINIGGATVFVVDVERFEKY